LNNIAIMGDGILVAISMYKYSTRKEISIMTIHEMKEKFLAYDVVWFMVFVGLGWLILYLLYMVFAVVVL
jgi:hypothetical protein